MIRLLDINDKTLGTVAVENGRMVATGFGEMCAKLVVIEPDTFRRLTPADGDAWLRALRYEFRTAYLRAVWGDYEPD